MLASTRLSLLAPVSWCQQVSRHSVDVAKSLRSQSGAGVLAVANQLYNKFKADGQELAHGDIAIVDVSWCPRLQGETQPTLIIFAPGCQNSPLSARLDASGGWHASKRGIRSADGVSHCSSFCSLKLARQIVEPQLKLVDAREWRDRQIRLSCRSCRIEEQ